MAMRHFIKLERHGRISLQKNNRKSLVDVFHRSIQVSSYSSDRRRVVTNLPLSTSCTLSSSFSYPFIRSSSSSFFISRNFWSFRSKNNNNSNNNKPENEISLSNNNPLEASTTSGITADDDNMNPTEPSTPLTDDTLTPDQAMANFEQLATSLVNQNTATSVVDSVALMTDSTISYSTSSSFAATWYYPQDHAVHFIEYIHNISGLNYAFTIALVTVSFRVLIFPLFVKAQRNTSRMAHMKPEMDVLKQRIDKLDPADRDGQLRFSMEMRKLFDKYQCNPFKALVVPLLQAPIFMSMFFALQKMPQYYQEEFSTGGILWFTDLAAPDPYHVLPVLSALSFLAIMELGKEQMMASSVNNPAQGRLMINFLRAVAVIMIPVTLDFSTAIFCYWTTNNTVSLIQTGLFRNANIRKSLGIWELPKMAQGLSSAADSNKGFVQTIQDAIQTSNKKGDLQNIKDQIKAHNEAIENKKKAGLLRKEKKQVS